MNLTDSARATLAVLVLGLGAMAACGPGKPKGPAGGPVSGAPDLHCTAPDGGAIAQATSQAACHPDAGPPDGGVAPVDYGPTLFGAEGDDDDCKYHVEWTSTPVYEDTDVDFTVTATRKSDGQPATGADIEAEVFLSDVHPAPNSGQHTTEGANGVYTVGPVRFDAPGKWTVRFHLYGACDDFTPDSPHGHAAFYVEVP